MTLHTEGRAVNGSHGALWEVLPAFDYLFKKLQVRANETVAKPHLFATHYSHCLNVAFLKLSEYFTETDKTLYYRAAVALHPFFRYDYFEETWINQDNGVDEIRRAKEATQQLYERYVAQAPPLAIEPPSTFYPIDGNDDDEDYELFFNFKKRLRPGQEQRVKTQRQETELERFMTDDLQLEYEERERAKDGSWKLSAKSYENSPLKWWRDHGEASGIG